MNNIFNSDLLKILNDNCIKYSLSNYCGYDSIVIINNHYKLEIFIDEQGYVSDLQKIPYIWGRMGFTTFYEILNDLKNYLNINITCTQLSFF